MRFIRFYYEFILIQSSRRIVEQLPLNMPNRIINKCVSVQLLYVGIVGWGYLG